MPAAIPVTIPDELPTVAIDEFVLTQLPLPIASLSVVVEPMHRLVFPMIGPTGFTVIVFVASAVLPHLSVAVTVYVVVVEGETVTLVPVSAPGIQTYEYGPTPFTAVVDIVVELPLHMVDGVAVIGPGSIVFPNTVIVSGVPAVI